MQPSGRGFSMRFFPAGLAALMLFAATLIVGSLWQFAAESTTSRIARTGVMRVGYAWEPPYAFRDASGRVTGESPEVARAVLTGLGIRDIEWLQTDFGMLIPELRAGRFDLIAAGMFINPAREALVRFSRPSVCIEPGLLVRRGNPLYLHRLEDIAAHPGARLAVLAGAVEAEDAVRAGIPAQRILSFPNPELAVTGIEQGLADALALSGPSVQRLARTLSSMERAVPFEGQTGFAECAAFAFRRQDGDLRDRFNHELDSFLGTAAHLTLVAALASPPPM